MKTFIVDVEKSVWSVNSYQIQADSLEEAQSKALEKAKTDTWLLYTPSYGVRYASEPDESIC